MYEIASSTESRYIASGLHPSTRRTRRTPIGLPAHEDLKPSRFRVGSVIRPMYKGHETAKPNATFEGFPKEVLFEVRSWHGS